MSEKRAQTTILVPGKLPSRALERIEEQFHLVRIDRADTALLTDEMKQSVEGIAAATVIDAAFIDALPKLRIIANFGVGYDSVDAAHAGSRGVMVTNTPDVLTEEVADTALGLLINTVRELPKAEAWLRAGRWRSDGAYPLTRATLRGRSVGIFGLGRIGRAIARRVEAFGLPVSYHNRRPVEGVDYEYHPTLLSLASAVDTLISVAPGGAATHKAVNAEVLAALGPNGVFVNVGRGSTVDEPALIEALRAGTILAAGLDVFADEPNVPEALIACENACLLPHVGSASLHTRQAMADLVVDNLVAWFTRGRALTPVAETAHLVAGR
ncbi:2-hydroxyacid dehydrogenase [Chelativorans intermedius]|uniref:2-hydroxyacid dehydrogenase n=1 Tax=Chelativorans intermedius TaxID=515947 RepID=A0ABV6D455_9HYPH|nr:2-hydroxyacid dehydrogenase [Chelativorans intermedius]MCT8997685.1 2-hydroxyacid dehydrogenase [Chelativorans intermedius]